MSPKTWKPDFTFPEPSVVRQAWNLFVFSSIFAILFNTFYNDGIELKVGSPKVSYLMDKPKNDANPADSYSGWKTTPVKTSRDKPIPVKPPYGAITRLSLMGAKDRFDKKKCVFLDARNPGEYKEGHIPGSLIFSALDMDKFAPLVMPQLTDKDQEIVAYCNGGDCTLSLELAHTLIQQGYNHVEVFEGGWPEWKKASFPVQTGENP